MRTESLSLILLHQHFVFFLHLLYLLLRRYQCRLFPVQQDVPEFQELLENNFVKLTFPILEILKFSSVTESPGERLRAAGDWSISLITSNGTDVFADFISNSLELIPSGFTKFILF